MMQLIKVPQIFSCALLILMLSLSLLVVFVDIHSPINIWVAFGTWKNFRYYSINNICQVLGGERSQGQYLSFMLSLGATPHHSFMVRQKICVGNFSQ